MIPQIAVYFQMTDTAIMSSVEGKDTFMRAVMASLCMALLAITLSPTGTIAKQSTVTCESFSSSTIALLMLQEQSAAALDPDGGDIAGNSANAGTESTLPDPTPEPGLPAESSSNPIVARPER